jgi:hypothetical protein
MKRVHVDTMGQLERERKPSGNPAGTTSRSWQFAIRSASIAPCVPLDELYAGVTLVAGP